MRNQLTLSDKLRTVPLLAALVPFVAGIVAGTMLAAPLYIWVAVTVACGVAAWSGREHKIASLYIFLAILFFGAALARVHTPRPVIPRDERIWMEVQIIENPTRRDKSVHTSGVVVRWRPETGDWQHAGEKLLVSFDTMYRFGAGERIVFRGYVNPVSDTTSSYSRLMSSRGYTGRTYISRYSLPTILPHRAGGLASLAKKLQSGATQRIHRLHLGADETAVVAAMTTGDRSGITPELRSAYSRSGASHLLAVSGLHVGIAFLLINILLYFIPLFPGGHIIKNIAAIAAIWFYATLTGLSPSAVRAAFMFTGAQAALATSQARSGANIMCGTALVMLAVRPGLLFDVSFQLSFIAVAAIMAWFGPLYRLVESRFKLLNALWATLIVGFTASVATLPLVSYNFGVFSPAGIVLNPLVITTAHLVVGFSLPWIAAPVPFLEPVFRWLVGGPVWLQNKAIELTGKVQGAAIEWTMPLWLVLAIYATMIIFTVWLACRSRRAEPFVLMR